jgi:adenylate kinase family enzyme
VYKNETKPVFDYYAQHNKSYNVNGVGAVDEIATRLSEVIRAFD